MDIYDEFINGMRRRLAPRESFECDKAWVAFVSAVVRVARSTSLVVKAFHKRFDKRSEESGLAKPSGGGPPKLNDITTSRRGGRGHCLADPPTEHPCLRKSGKARHQKQDVTDFMRP